MLQKDVDAVGFDTIFALLDALGAAAEMRDHTAHDRRCVDKVATSPMQCVCGLLSHRRDFDAAMKKLNPS